MIDALAAMKRSQPETVRALLRAGTPIGEIFAIITDLNLEIHRRLLEHAIATVRVNGISRPPVPVTLVVMGSAGRRESFLNPDQDNGFILGDYADEDHGRIDPYFIALAERFNSDLADVGFPLCLGNIMARNPVWRKTERQWFSQIDRWMHRRDPVAVRFGDAFLDFWPAAGPHEPAARLRAHLNHAFQNDSAMLTELCRDGPHHRVALGWFGHLATEDRGEHHGAIDLKAHGILPLISAVRLWALRHCVPATRTVARLQALGQLDVLEASEAQALIDAYFFVAGLVLRRQSNDALAGAKFGYWIEPKELEADERDRLVGALRHISDFQSETRAIFAGELY